MAKIVEQDTVAYEHTFEVVDRRGFKSTVKVIDYQNWPEFIQAYQEQNVTIASILWKGSRSLVYKD